MRLDPADPAAVARQDHLVTANHERATLLVRYTAERACMCDVQAECEHTTYLADEIAYRDAIHAANLDADHEDDEAGYEPEWPMADGSRTHEDCAACDRAIAHIDADATEAALDLVKQLLREARAAR